MEPIADPLKHVAATLLEAQRLGMLGARPVPEAIAHATAFVTAIEGFDGPLVDVGSGAGLPGLVIAALRSDLTITLLDRRTARTDFLARHVRRLGWSDRVDVVATDVRQFAAMIHAADRAAYRLAVARGFRDPLTTLELTRPLLDRGGRLVVSEPPTPREWPRDHLERRGFVRLRHDDARVAVFEAVSPGGA
jgi:16S rRNA G527 N7-methylase RsmG